MPLDVARLFSYHRPTNGQAARYTKLRAAAGVLAQTIQELTPPSAEQTLALRQLHQVSMQANAAIAVNEPDWDEIQAQSPPLTSG
ncbi:MAG: hypothetical protein DRQ55_11170 [Planctomycetota bacterium]|nr:MAG: hypothetical protein DRQ55_11170 [Planctomycetota bacterium]RKZ10667.1 MAG: hypothetical protein DRQ32_06920 [bacterium]